MLLDGECHLIVKNRLDTPSNSLFLSGPEGRDARCNGTCNRSFHQTCLGRREEASQDKRWTSAGGFRKDIRHHCCAECLLGATGSNETLYTGKLDGMSAALFKALSTYELQQVDLFYRQGSGSCQTKEG